MSAVHSAPRYASNDGVIETARAALGGMIVETLDAVGEVTNLVAGGVKVRVAGRANVSVGLPLALRGKVFPSTGSQSIHGVMCLDDADVWLLLTGTKTSKR